MMYSEITAKGTEIATTWLKTHGYFKITVIQAANDEYIEADGKSRRILVKVKVAQNPNQAEALTEDEKNNILYNASELEREPWLAECEIDQRGQMLGDIKWKNLSKLQ